MSCDAIVWIDRSTAMIQLLSERDKERRTLVSAKGAPLDSGADEFVAQVARELLPASRILILGPGVAKHHLYNFLREQLPRVFRGVVGCETAEQPSERSLSSWSRKYFAVS